MPWNWVWIGAALVAGFYLGMTLMSLLAIAQQPTREPGRGNAPGRARMARALWRHRRPA